MNIWVKRAIFSILIIANCIVIFCFSSQDSKKSSDTSEVVVDKVVTTINNVSKKPKKPTLKDEVTFYVRKTAHFSIYTLLGIWLFSLANTFEISKSKKIIASIIFGALYAISDEFHQSFIGGRSCEFRDVCIDSSGALFGILICMGIIFCIKKILEKRLKNECKKSV